MFFLRGYYGINEVFIDFSSWEKCSSIGWMVASASRLLEGVVRNAPKAALIAALMVLFSSLSIMSGHVRIGASKSKFLKLILLL